MKQLLSTALLAFTFLAFGSGAHAADLKIATVDFRKAFDSYYKTVQASIIKSNNIVEAHKTLDSMNDAFKKLQDEWQAEYDKSNDMGTTKEERDKHKKSANDLSLDLRIQNETITNYVVRTDEKLRLDEYQHVTNLTAEIRGVLEGMAKKQGFTFVLDRTGLTMTANPLVLYSSGENDLTDVLIKELNSTAPPAPTLEPGSAPETPAPRGSGAKPAPNTSPPK